MFKGLRQLAGIFSGPRRPALGVALLVGVGLLFVLAWLVPAYEAGVVVQAREQAQGRLAGYDKALSSSLSRRLLILEGLRAFAEGELNTHAGELGEDEFLQVARGLYDTTTGLGQIWFAPDGIQRYSYPPNPAGVGLDLLRSLPADRAEEVAEAIRSRQIVNSPVLFRPDGLVLEGRLAVFYESRFWGLLVLTLDLGQAFKEAGLAPQIGGFQFALQDDQQRLLLGSDQVFGQDPVTQEISFPGGAWKLGVVPAQGWPAAVAPLVDVVRLLGLAVVGMIAVVVYLIYNRQTRLVRAVAQRTQELNLELVERRRAEDEVRENEEKYRTLVETAPDAVLLQTPDGQLVNCNSAACQVFGYTKEEFLALKMADLLPETVARLLATGIGAVSEILTGGTFIETRYRRKNGLEFQAEVNSSRVSVAGQAFIISYIRDITRRKEAEESVRDSQERYRSLVDTSPDAIALIDLHGRILLANRKAAALYEYSSPEEMVGVNVHDLVAPEDRQRSLENARSLLDDHAPYRDEQYTSITSRGRRFPSENSASAIFDSKGQMIGVTGISRDVSERKQARSEQAALVVVASALRTAVTLEGISENILNQLMGLLAAEGAALFVVLPATGENLCVRGVARWGQWSGVRLGQGEGVTSRVVSTGQPFVNNDIQRHPQTARLELMGGLNAVAGAPLIAQERTIGALWVGRTDPFREGELRVLMVIADMVASAIHRAALYEETSRRLQRLDTLHQIDQTITAAQSLRHVIDFLLDKLMSQLGVDAADLFLVDEKSQTLYFLAGRGFRRASLRGLRIQPGEGCAGRVAAGGRTIYYSDLRVANLQDCASQVAGEDFISYCGLPLVAKQQLRGVLEVFDRTARQPDPEWLDFLETLAGQAAIAIDNSILLESLQHTNQELVLAYDRTLEGWARALELRDKETEGHTRRVADLTVRMGAALGMTPDELVQVRRGALLHDIGKIGVPDAVLNKPGPLTPDEWQIMRKHPTHARTLIEPIPYLRPTLDIPYSHHEHWDGSGYPQGLAGEQIPLAARIFTVIDVWDALISKRVYRDSWTGDQARAYLHQNAGVLFDPQVVEAFFRIGGDHWGNVA